MSLRASCCWVRCLKTVAYGFFNGDFGRRKGLVEAYVQFDGQSFVRLYNVAISLQERGNIFHDFLGRQEAVLIPPSSGSVLLSSLLTA